MESEWIDSFDQFYTDMGPKPTPSHSIERVDNRGNYSKENCIWGTRTEQSINRGVPSNNSSGTTGVGFNKGMRKWCARIKINYKHIYLDSFDNKEDAIACRKAAELKYFEKAPY